MNQDGHFFAPKTYHLLPKRIIDELGLIWATLHMPWIGPPDARPPGVVIPLELRSRHLNNDVLSALELCGIPARREAPFLFSYPDVLLPCLPERVNRAKFFSHLTDIMYCYWAVHTGVLFLCLSNVPQKAAESRATQDQLVGLIMQKYGTAREDVERDIGARINTDLMMAKWFVDATVVKIRALWDKMLVWLGQDYFGLRFRSEKWGKKIGQLVADVAGPMEDGAEKQLLDTFVALCCELDILKEYRDNDLHNVSPRLAEVLGRSGKHKDALELWDMVLLETGRCMEALTTCFAIILAGAGKVL
ncbi:MAG: hypothetical protein M1370_07385 [Bacteroidetes bacterium]|nr:hypothetical protein [Bacteroidota bacterium]